MSSCGLKSFVRNGRKIYGAAFNYSRSFNGDPPITEIQEPVLFLKAPSDYITEGHAIIIPKGYTLVEEIELGVIVGKVCRKVSVLDALDYIGGYCIAFDMTVTNIMGKIRSQGWPWTIIKSFDTSCPVSDFIPKEAIPDSSNVELFCTINGKIQQTGNTKDLVFSPAELVSYISQYHTLEPNDVILTGTPPTPGVVKDGDVIKGGITNGVTIEFSVKNCDYTNK
ncbi:hypothetical protein FQA39_LY02935 [Lamprigera yunnana]|nr:hypothetical protein FQA39_LY02935 [Lamprigera yunnana]